jgi:predicted AlkP superfamily phosphohydrolase/phosphomutase
MKLFVLALDGVPLSLIEEAFRRGRMSNLQRLSEQGGFREIDSVIPVVSSVAWATFSTGVNPARHGITGFVERDERLNYVLLTSSHLKMKSLWRRLSEQGMRVIALNVPTTYPPEPIDGVIVGDFLSPSIEKAVHPRSLVPLLQRFNYIIEPEPRLAHKDKSAFLEEVHRALEGRKRLATRLLVEEDWDLFMLHVMETDRMNHFFWDAKDDPHHPYHHDFWEFYACVDELIGQIADGLDSETELMILSDHGFCGIKLEVNLNRYLEEMGFLHFREGAQALSDLDPSSRAYSLTPGRIYLNLRGRETLGSVDPEDVPSLLQELKEALYDLKGEEGEPIIQRVYKREEIYQGPLMAQVPELIAHPIDGYDLKAGVGGELFSRSARSGMHTYEGAFVYVRWCKLKADERASIIDVTPTIFQLLGLDVPVELEGESLLS